MVVSSRRDFPGFFERVDVWGQVGLTAREYIFDGQDLDSRIVAVPAVRVVEAFSDCFLGHWFCGLFERQEDADGGLFAFYDVAEVAYLRKIKSRNSAVNLYTPACAGVKDLSQSSFLPIVILLCKVSDYLN